MSSTKLENSAVPSFESLSLEEMHALEGDTDANAEFSPVTTSSMPCTSGIGGGITVVLTIKRC